MGLTVLPEAAAKLSPNHRLAWLLGRIAVDGLPVVDAYWDDVAQTACKIGASYCRVIDSPCTSATRISACNLALASRDMGDHSIGAIWRREHLSCPTREELSSYKEEALDTQRIDYIKFHLEIVGCNACQANLLDLNSAKDPKANPAAREKHRQFLENSKLLLPKKQ